VLPASFLGPAFAFDRHRDILHLDALLTLRYRYVS
jgi:hypothetical protein